MTLEPSLHRALDALQRLAIATLGRRTVAAADATVVLNERELWATDDYRSALDQLMRVAYQWHPYGRPSIGAESDVRNVPVDRLEAFGIRAVARFIGSATPRAPRWGRPRRRRRASRPARTPRRAARGPARQRTWRAR